MAGKKTMLSSSIENRLLGCHKPFHLDFIESVYILAFVDLRATAEDMSVSYEHRECSH